MRLHFSPPLTLTGSRKPWSSALHPGSACNHRAEALHNARSTLVDPNFVFVVMSFDASMEPAYDAVKAAAEVCGLVAKRVKDVPGDYRITDKMLGLIASARLIVVDLSLERPNVYFELGYARGLGKRVITILRKGSTAHFDVRDWQYLEYVDSRPLEKDLADRFRYELQRGAEDD